VVGEPAAAGVPGKVFLSYRREDTRHLADRLYDRLAERFGVPAAALLERPDRRVQPADHVQPLDQLGHREHPRHRCQRRVRHADPHPPPPTVPLEFGLRHTVDGRPVEGASFDTTQGS
jgi:hypothetical protein